MTETRTHPLKFEVAPGIPVVKGESCWEFPFWDGWFEDGWFPGSIEFVNDNRIGYDFPGGADARRGSPDWSQMLAIEVR